MIEFTSPLVEAEWLNAHLDDPSLRIFDCSQAMAEKPDGTLGFQPSREAHLEARIPGSVFVDVIGELSDKDHPVPMMMPSPEDFAQRMRRLGVGDNTAVVVYDRGNHAWAARVWYMLGVCGFHNCAVLNGGFRRWQALGLPLESGEHRYSEAEALTATGRQRRMASKEDVLAAIEAERTVLLHSLPRPLFTGEKCAYARPGRIAGSEHLFCEAGLDPDDYRFADEETLRALVEPTGALDADHVITYCGGGIAASNNALVLTLIGVSSVAVYDGSLSEWTADPDLPMEVG